MSVIGPGVRVCAGCGKALQDGEIHVKAPEGNSRGIKCLVMLDLARELGLGSKPPNERAEYKEEERTAISVTRALMPGLKSDEEAVDLLKSIRFNEDAIKARKRKP